MDRLKGKVALITGASRGIGRGIAEAFVDEGASVVITSRNAEEIESAANALGPSAMGVSCSVSDAAAMAACVRATLDRFGALDVLVNNAASNTLTGRVVDLDVNDLRFLVDTNVFAPLLLIQECWNACMARRGGSIVNISSIGADRVGGNNGSYRFTKRGLDFLTRHLAVELAPNVRVNGIAPGTVVTSMSKDWSEHLVRTGNLPPLGRLGDVEDVAEIAVYLASDASSWMTGSIVTIDGGMSLTS